MILSLTVPAIATLSASAEDQSTLAGADDRREQGQQEPITPARNVVQSEEQAELLRRLAASPKLIERLNNRYQNTRASCPDGRTPLYCTGLLIRRSVYSSSFDFWTHSPAAKALGSVTLSFIRADANTNGNDISSGFILMDDATAQAREKQMPSFRCIYPFSAGTQNANRPLHGCGFANSEAPPRVDESTCGTLADPAITATRWIANFQRFGSNRANQCSLSTKVPTQVIASLEVRQQLSTPTDTYGNELLAELWDEQKPESLPIEAFFFNPKKSGSFSSALELRDAYYIKTSQLLPLVRLDFNASGNAIVTALSEQEQGEQISNGLNLRLATLAKTVREKHRCTATA